MHSIQTFPVSDRSFAAARRARDDRLTKMRSNEDPERGRRKICHKTLTRSRMVITNRSREIWGTQSHDVGSQSGTEAGCRRYSPR
jgi:hypothetical protein